MLRDMAAVFADAAVYGFKALSKESTPSPYDEKSGIGTEEPWNNLRMQDPCVCTRQDLIIFAEFSEVMGPIPLLTIPPRAEEITDIDINNFIMKIMSIDYQANLSDSVFCEDAQVLQMFVMPGVHAYVHYLTLHDPGARGFVRPLCLAYVCSDQYKLQQLFPKLRNEFLQVTKVVKHDNRLWFAKQISNIINGIKETQNEYLYWKKKEEDGSDLSDEEQQILTRTNMDQLVQQSTDYSHMLHTLEPLLKEDAGVSEAITHRWKSAFERAEKVNIIHAVLDSNSRHAVVGSNGNTLRGVFALSPWGLSAALWNLLVLLHSHRECRLVPKNITECVEDHQAVFRNNVEDALSDAEYMQLINNMAHPPEFSTSKTSSHHGACSSSHSMDLLEANIMTSGNEVASSYHSVPESLSEILAGTQLLGENDEEVNEAEEALPDLKYNDPDAGNSDNSSSDSFLDISETSSVNEDNWSANPYQSESKKSHCVWSYQKTGSWILKFFQIYETSAHHVLYSILIGRTVVLVGHEGAERRASHIMNALSPFVPVMPGQEVQILRWRFGTLVSEHISTYHMIGLCIPERLSVHEMISSKNKNSVTILDVSSKQLFGPAYSGQLLGSLKRTVRFYPSDQSLMLFLQTIAATINEKLFMYKALLEMKSASKRMQSQLSPGSEVLKELGIEGCDAEIVRNLSKIGSVNWSPKN